MSPLTRQTALIVAVALGLRLVHLWQMQGAPVFRVLMGDARSYDAWARRIAAGDWIGSDVFYQAPLYPYFLGVIYTVVGPNATVVRVVQAMVGATACGLLGLAAARLLSRRAGLVAGLGLAVYAPAIFFDALVQKTVLDVFFMCLALWLMSGLVDPPAPVRRWLALGVVLGCLTLTRENALALTAVAVVWALAHRTPGEASPSSHGRAIDAGAVLLGLALVVSPVAARNALVGGGLYLTTAQFGPNFYIGNNPRADGTYMSLRPGRGAPEYEREDATTVAEAALGRQLTPAEVSGYWTDRALGFIASQPGAWIGLLGRKVALLWNASEMLDTESQQTHAERSLVLRLGAWVGHFGVLVPLAFVGLVATWSNRRRLWPFYAMALAYAASVVLFYVFARYRFPLVPILMLFASAGIVSAAPLVRSRSPRWRALLAGAAVGVAVFTNWPLLSATTMRAVTENNLAAALQEDGHLDEAIAHYVRSTELKSDYAPAYNNMGTALRARGRLADAVVAYEQALRTMPDYPDAHYNLANALLEQRRTADAIGHLRLAARGLPGSAPVHNNLGKALAEAGQGQEAADALGRAVALDPDSVTAHHNLGHVLASLGRLDDAVAHLRRATEIAPADGEALFDLGSLLLEAGRLPDAVAALREAVRLSPASAKAHNNLGIALGSQGRLREAIARFEQALQLQPGFEDARRNLELARRATD